jgi:hypothetical protein
MMDLLTILQIVGFAALGFFVLRFGMAMNNLEQRVSDMQDRLDGIGNT